ncbi:MULTISPECIES: GNAT family N-acetyltransferase [Bacillus]|uniref:GNAT family N-acetyltransferase n=1 Tax=Bacillus TaxID=1386 RepID=UPI0024A80E24|nr:GNAT family N-acetyltransferase [Bacillus altitudinis]MDI6646887.1 GNAT family N-acetyltransferase [Bacillus altitudinis]MDI6661509.1 GNAT family N-acetyltransferase [Bacillus altitudinis]UJM28947.1 GNAT family N-acetyltransferase [Bacillus aerophilus]WOI42642.1 GNAT family N-acetyltransferase [Bacillus altitudinis]
MQHSNDIIVRFGKIEDAETTLEIQKSVIAESDYLLTTPEEYKKTLLEHKEWIQKRIENENETYIVAETGDQVIGWIAFEQSSNRKRTSHVGSFGLMVDKSYRGLGIGEMLLTALLNWAEKNPSIEKVSLAVFSTNQKAISLYKKMGFLEEGRKINEFKINDHEYWDDVLMYKLV